MSYWHSVADQSLLWNADAGMGILAQLEGPIPYDADYLAKYEGYAQTDMGEKITRFRVDLVEEFHKGLMIDVGCCAGSFMRERGAERTYGYDVIPAVIERLKADGLYMDPYDSFDAGVPALSMWDVMEHLADPQHILRRVARGGWVFLSIPIFDDLRHVLESRHYRRTEHHLYFTEDGLTRFMAAHGFSVRAKDNTETVLGREDIMSYAFQREDE